MIQIDHVSKSYDGGKTFSVKDLSLEIRDGEIFGLLGPNGAGKSTTLNMLAGVLAPTKGTVTVNGIDVAANPIEAKRSLSFVGDSPDHLLRLRGREYLRFIADVYGVPEDVRAPRISKLAEDYGMADKLDDQDQLLLPRHAPEDDGHGRASAQPRRLGARRAHDPALTPRRPWLLKQSMREHADAGKTVLFSTHVLDVAEKVVDRVGIIAHGELLFVGTVDQMREHFRNNGLPGGDVPGAHGRKLAPGRRRLGCRGCWRARGGDVAWPGLTGLSSAPSSAPSARERSAPTSAWASLAARVAPPAS